MSRPGDTSYEISRPSGVCAATGEPLALGEAYIAALVERDGQEGLERLDYSEPAWEKGHRPGPPLRLFGFWRARYEPGESKQRPLIDDESLLDLFEQLEGAADSARLSFRYILALLLVRKKLLRFEGIRREEGSSTMLLRRPAEAQGPPCEVIDPGMDEAQIEQAIEQLGTIMTME
jgi:hypothetical protein